VLGRYAIERFLYRLGRSEYRDNFALKGATLFTLWTGQTHRPTKDLDLLGRGLSSTITEVETIIRGICATPEDDGIVFDGELVEGARIKEDDEYDGARVKFQAKLSGVRIPMQVDIGFGDAIYPEPELTSFPVLLPMEAPLIRAYPREATIAEIPCNGCARHPQQPHEGLLRYLVYGKHLGVRDGLLAESYRVFIQATRHATPRGHSLCTHRRLSGRHPKKMQWNAFVNRLDADEERPTLAEIGTVLRTFLLPCISKESERESRLQWSPTHHWH